MLTALPSRGRSPLRIGLKFYRFALLGLRKLADSKIVIIGLAVIQIFFPAFIAINNALKKFVQQLDLNLETLVTLYGRLPETVYHDIHPHHLKSKL
jgi:hypothetical protein